MLAILAVSSLPAALVAQDKPERAAAVERIGALASAGRIDQALSAYDSFVEARGTPDVELLAMIARAELERAGRAQADPQLAASALERLSEAGDRKATERLETIAVEPSGDAPSGLRSTGVLARLGHKDAVERLAGLLENAPNPDKLQVIRVITGEKLRLLAPNVAKLLDDPDPAVRVAAVAAVADLNYEKAVPRLRRMFEADVPLVRARAAAALARLGDNSGESHLYKMLKSGIPDVRLTAAEALARMGRTDWIEPVRELRNDRDELARIRAAAVLACCDVPTARAVLVEALGSPNPPLRNEAARVLETSGLADARLVRRMLGDSFESVRIHGAGAALRLVSESRGGRDRPRL